MNYEQAEEFAFKNFDNCLQKLSLVEKSLEDLCRERIKNETTLINISQVAPEVFRREMQRLADEGFEISLDLVLNGYSEKLQIKVEPNNAAIRLEVGKLVDMARNLRVEIPKKCFKRC